MFLSDAVSLCAIAVMRFLSSSMIISALPAMSPLLDSEASSKFILRTGNLARAHERVKPLRAAVSLRQTAKTASFVEEKTNPLLSLKVRDFRFYWLALVTQVIGQHMFAFTLGWLAFEITGSQAQLGLIHLCGFVPQF